MAAQAKAMAGGESKAPAAEQAAPEYGAKYQQHMGTLQKQLEEAKQTWATQPSTPCPPAQQPFTSLTASCCA